MTDLPSEFSPVRIAGLVAGALLILTTNSALLADTYTVTNTDDTLTPGTLRQAITDANAHSNAGNPGGVPDRIEFAILGGGVHTIAPGSGGLPAITDPVVIDGYTQTGAAQNTDPNGFNGTLLIELDGTNAGMSTPGLTSAAGSSTIRGLVINRFDGEGIALNSGSNLVEGNFIGTNAAGTTALGNNAQGVRIDSGNSNIVGGTVPGARNVISGNDEGMEIRGVCNTNMVEGNFIGTNAAGTGALGNVSNGIRITNGPTGTIVGGTVAGARNVISANQGDGVNFQNSNASGSFVRGNFIGTDVNGTADLGNTFNGVRINGAPTNTIGGTASGARNIISGNNENGVSIIGSTAMMNQVQGNFIGTDVNGTADLGNTNAGVYIFGAPNNTIGGTSSGARNIISGNDFDGVVIDNSAATMNMVQGNFIGTDVNGTAALDNSDDGVSIQDAPNNMIGGSATGAGNLISGNNDDGIFISGATATNNMIQGNLIGTKANGTDALGNVGDGIDFSSASPAFNNTIGGLLSGEPNVIAFNGNRGVVVAGTGNGILSNSIFSNTNLGIDLGPPGVTPNDTCDPDTGDNNLQNFPVLTSASSTGATTNIQGALNSTATTQFRVEFFSNAQCDTSGFGEGESFIGSTNVMTNAGCDASLNVNLPVSVPVGDVITATATDPNDNTSEFSNCAVVSSASPTPTPTPTPTPCSTVEVHPTAAPTTVRAGQTATFTVSSIHGPAACPKTVYYSMSGNAILGSDYTLSGTPGQVTIPAGSSSGTVTLHANSPHAKKVTATMTLSSGSGYTISSKAKFRKASVKIQR